MFQVETNIAQYENPALHVGGGPVPMDSSSVSEVFAKYTSNSAPRVINAGEPSSFNTLDVEFNIRIPAANRVCFNRSFIQLDYYAVDMTGPAPYAPIATATVGVPWNTIASCIDNAEIQFNSSADQVEKLTQNLGHGSMAKFLTSFSRPALEGMSDSLFTPCIESARDTTSGGLSPETVARSVRNLIQTDGSIRYGSKNIYMCDLFDSLRLPAAFYVQTMKLNIRPKASNDILFQMPANVAPNRFFVANLTLFLSLLTLTEAQLATEAKKIEAVQSLVRESFWMFDPIIKQHSQGITYRDSGVKNMQAAILMFSSTDSPDGKGLNRYQYTYGNSIGGMTSGIGAYQMRYDTVYSPAIALAVDTSNKSRNTPLYAQYRTLCKRMNDRESPPALEFTQHMGQQGEAGGLVDANPYVLFCSVFFPLTAYGHKLMAGSEHEITTSGGGTQSSVIVRIRLSFVELMGDTTIRLIK